MDVTVVNNSSRTIKVMPPDGDPCFLQRGGQTRFDADEEEDFEVRTLRGGRAFYRYASAELLTVDVTD